MYIAFSLYIFLDLITYIIIAHIILSFLQIVGIRWNPIFINSIIDPLFKQIKNIIPTNIGPFDLTPIIIFIIISFLIGIIEIIFPGSLIQYNSYKTSIL